jgi:toxin FitB
VIILDTNVISELIRQSPEPSVISWLDSLPPADVAITAITAAELLYGVARLPDGRRKAELAEAVRAMISEDFRDSVEPFDIGAAGRYAAIVAERDRLGRPIGMADAQIAAVCLSLGASLATRNTEDFTDAGIDLIDPWNLEAPGDATEP